MPNLDHNSQAITSEEFQKRSWDFVDEFLQEAKGCPLLVPNLLFYPTEAAYRAKQKRPNIPPLYSVKEGNGVTIHLCEEALKKIPTLALQGWLDLELASCLLKLHPELYQFNFSRQILPLFPVSGSAVSLVRHMVERLKSGLERYISTRIIIDVGHGASQVYFYFYRIDPHPAERDNYHRFLAYKWIRASFLCQKLQEFISVSLLAERNISFSVDLKSHWWKCHEYFLSEDKRLLEKLAAIPDIHGDEPFSSKLIEMFKNVQSHLFARPSQTQVSGALH